MRLNDLIDRIRLPHRLFALAAAAVLAAPVITNAALIVPSGWTRGTGTSTYEAWDVFTAPAGPNSPDKSGAATYPTGSTYAGSLAPNVYDTSGTGFITSGGNIYSFSGPTNIHADVPGYDKGSGFLTTVLLQVRTLGTEPVYTGVGGVRLTYDGNTIYPVDSAELARTALGGMGGSQVDSAFVFHVPTDPGSLSMEIDASGSSMSMDMLSVDTIVTTSSQGYAVQAAPEPASIGMVGLSLVGLLLKRRNRATREV